MRALFLVLLLGACVGVATPARAAVPAGGNQTGTLGGFLEPPATTPPGKAQLRQRDDIRDIHGPIAVTAARPTWWAVGAGTVVVLAAAATELWSRRGRRRLPPDVRALRALAQQRTLAAGQPRAFAVAVSETVRAYLEEAFSIDAPRRTTDELLADLVRDRSGPLAAHQFELTEFLRQCDLAKFAGAALSPARMAAMLDSAEALVRATAVPAPAAVPLAGVAS